MEHYELNFHRRQRPAFDEVPAEHRRRAFGVDYVAVRGMQGGEFYFTRAGWARAPSLLPREWYDNERFCRIGKALPKATGSVYLVPVPHPVRGSFGLVVKFCRFAQDIGCTHLDPGLLPPEVAGRLFGAEFSGPFEEVGRLMQLRAQAMPDGRRFRTEIPLGVYCPSKHFAPWQLGRDETRQWRYDAALASSQATEPARRRIVHRWERLYVLLYQWIEGIDLEEAGRRGLLSEADVRTLTIEAGRDLLAAGYTVLDHKARHLIVRPSVRTSRLLRHRGKIPYALIDYELLVPVKT